MPQVLEEHRFVVDPERLEQLIQLFHLRWHIALLAALHENPALGRVAPLVSLLDVGRSTVRRTLASLQELGWVAINPGYGHPLRPEQILTDHGKPLAAWCDRFVRLLRRRPGLQQIAFQKWPMIVLWAVGCGCSRFSELEQLLPQISPRALSLALKELGEAGLVQREVYDSAPVTIVYRTQRKAHPMLGRLREFFD